jgi:hypothetical protein
VALEVAEDFLLALGEWHGGTILEASTRSVGITQRDTIR